jgi:hypothetical protein
MQGPDEFEGRIASLDPGLFDLVESQSNEKDRRSWLALQRAVREAKAPFVYLEIGSYLGGSLQQYLRDPKCSRIYSIDNRTRDQRHADNSERTMLENLRAVAPRQLPKLICFDSDARDLRPGSVLDVPDVCFIDGEHTNEAVLSDFAFCLGVCASDAVIYFHDAGCTRAGIAECLRRLRRSNQPFVAHKLPGNTFVVALADSPVGSDPRVGRMAVAVNGERWLLTSPVAKRARRWVPAALRPACARARDLLWGAARRSR